MRGPRARARRRSTAGGFTMVEVLVAMTIMAIGLVGILALQQGAATASGYARRATEAAVLAEDKLEELRTAPIDTDVTDEDVVDAIGVPDPDGLFRRSWQVAWVSDLGTITVTVRWAEEDGEHAITFRTQRLR